MITKPVPHEIEALPSVTDCDSNELKVYINLARQINFLPQELSGILRNQVMYFFQEKHITLFDYREVHMYLFAEAYRLLQNKGIRTSRTSGRLIVPVWCWQPLRIQDCGHGWQVAIPYVKYGNKAWETTLGVQFYGNPCVYREHYENSAVGRHGFYDPQSDACRPYDKLIPMRILDRVRELEERAKDQFVGKIRFFVSDFDQNFLYPTDPFIAAKVGHGQSQDDLLIFDVWDEPGFTD